MLRDIGAADPVCPVSADACRNCVGRENSRQPNSMTVGIAILAAGPSSREAAKIAASHKTLIDKAAASTDAPPDGVGTELKRLIAKWLRITPEAGCRCNEYAAELNRCGIAWCESHVPEITQRLKHEARARKLPFNCFVAKQFVCAAVRAASKKRKSLGDQWHGVP